MLSSGMAVSPGETLPTISGHRWRGTICAGLFLLALCTVSGAVRAQEPRFFRIGTAATAGSFFEIGGAIAAAISKPADSPACEHGGSCGVPGLVAVAQATQGSVENLRLINGSQIESGFAQADLAGWAFAGTGAFAGTEPMTRLRAIASLFPESLHLVTRADGPIQTLADLKGRRVSLGEPQSGTVANARVLLQEAGLGIPDLDARYLRPGQAAEELKEGTLDAFFLVGSYPVPAVRALAAAFPIRLVSIDAGLARRMQEKYRFYRGSLIPADSYPGVASEAATIGFNALWLVSAETDPDLVYAITKSLWSGATQELLAARDRIGNRVRLVDALADLSVPLHPGAERFYREAGLLSDGAPGAGSD